MAVTLRFNSRFNTPFNTGQGANNLVPTQYSVSLDGHPYMLEWEKDAIEVWGAKYKSNALPLLRSQADQSNTPGEQSISPENFWRRSQENWVNGSGQSQQDRKGSSDTRFNSIESRFYSSKGCDPWTPYELSLLNDTSKVKATAGTGLQIVVCGTYVYLLDTGVLSVSSDGVLAVWANVTGLSGTVNSITSDGTNLYCATSVAIYTVAGTVATSYVGATVATVLSFVKGRLMAVVGTALYNITGAPPTGALNTALITKLTGWNWVGFAGGQSQIYAAGYSGTQSSVYRTTILADGTSLTAPINAGDLPSGEIVRSLFSYQSYVVIGSDLGVRFCSVASDGSLNIGSLIPTTSPVYCFEAQDHFIWYGLTNFDSVSTGLGRMDLNTFTFPLTPAYASDLMAGTLSVPIQGAVKSVSTYKNYRIFTVEGYGIYAELLATPVASGTMTTGWINYNLIDPKLALFLDIAHYPLHGTISAYFAADNGPSEYVGIASIQGSSVPSTSFDVAQKSGFQFRVKLILTPTANLSPRLTRWTLRSYPTPTRSNQFTVPLLLDPTVLDRQGNPAYVNVTAELSHLRALLGSQQVVSYQEGVDAFKVIMFDYQFLPKGVDRQTGQMYGIFLAILNQVTS
jgi:hypothetical protein